MIFLKFVFVFFGEKNSDCVNLKEIAYERVFMDGFVAKDVKQVEYTL